LFFTGGEKRALEKRIVENVGLATLSPDNPLTALYIYEPKFCCDCSRFCTLAGIYDNRPADTK
jgi:hypothetical protein